ncbi:MAG TPA: hypothetical protein VIA18_21510 [Polyangia bacterium]|jgi:hypothetical protein|nr:hypothetical protein [Polyangia bacterium]HWE29924.1 hypothetical protein [Polyangia bacterium]
MTPARQQAHDHRQLLARLYAAADSVETTRDLVSEIRQADGLADARPEVRGLVELVGRARELLQSLIAVERDPVAPTSAANLVAVPAAVSGNRWTGVAKSDATAGFPDADRSEVRAARSVRRLL